MLSIDLYTVLQYFVHKLVVTAQLTEIENVKLFSEFLAERLDKIVKAYSRNGCGNKQIYITLFRRFALGIRSEKIAVTDIV